MNNKTTNVLLGILIIVLIAIGIILVKGQSNHDYRTEINRQNTLNSAGNYSNNPAPVNTQNPSSVTTTSNSTKQVNWKSVTSSSVFNLYKNAGLSVGDDDKPTLLKEIDLTGDGIPEAIFSASTGNASSSVILISNSDGSVSVAKTKDKNSKIGNAEVWEAGMATYSMGYKLLPNEKGFYTDSRSASSGEENGDVIIFRCNPDSIAAYQWNSKTNLFEYNSTLTAKYTAIECK